MASQSRQYDIVLFGATGYTGKYCAEHITTHLPTDLKWALAGRNGAKLREVAAEIKPLNAGRAQPAIETCALDIKELKALASKTRLLINTVGPYWKYSTPVVQACVESKTHYVDVTGESPWVLDIIKQFHAKAQEAGVIMIPQCGVESAPSDLLTWALIEETRKRHNVGSREVVVRTQMIGATPSGGTVATILSLMDKYSPSYFAHSITPGTMSIVKPPNTKHLYRKSWGEAIFGVRWTKNLGYLTDSFFGPPDRAWVYRSWSLYDEGRLYGPAFRFSPYGRAKSWTNAAMVHFMFSLGGLLLLLKPMRWLASKFMVQPGGGAPKEQARKEKLIYTGVMTPDASGKPDVTGELRFDGSMYHLSGVLLAEAAWTILNAKDTRAHSLGGGVLTPATLGQPFVDRLARAEMSIKFDGAVGEPSRPMASTTARL